MREEVEYYRNKLLLSLFHSFLLTKPCVKVHLVDFIKALLVKVTDKQPSPRPVNFANLTC